MPWLRPLSYSINLLANWQVKLCGALIVVTGIAMTIIILLQVFFRFVIYAPFPWSEEIARFIMIWMAMFGSVIAFRRGRHIGVRFVVERLPVGVYDRFIAPVVQLTTISFLALLAWQGWQLAYRSRFQVSPAFDLPMIYPYLAVPVGMTMMVLDVLGDFLHDRCPTPAGSTANIATSSLVDLDTIAACAREEQENGTADTAEATKSGANS
ncbi:TRAP transporter small permease [Oceanidesulfovibrio marinus]|uniref:TRAP transporter small permease n=1 Tax=Oceanidesulfovibrio marinus TaxID=370038 RepID=A0ABX6NDU7_9BACT|nr:TRAP transporter small permease [Oceanidesulfovibrio marinus]QJT08778.1 TRAP transporter small permease [Oceanidesulfovibrio marinus]